jgi:hypothetical protein
MLCMANLTIRLARSLVYYVMFYRLLFVLFRLVIALPVLKVCCTWLA